MKRSTAPVSQKFEFRSSLTLFQACLSTVKPLYNEPLYNEVPVTTNGFHYPLIVKYMEKNFDIANVHFVSPLALRYIEVSLYVTPTIFYILNFPFSLQKENNKR